jgi:hypothetical protein
MTRGAPSAGWPARRKGVVTVEACWSAGGVQATYEERSQQICNAVLRGLADGQDVQELLAELARSDDRRRPHPARAVLDLAVGALAQASPDPAQLVVYEGMREAYLPEVEFRGRVQHRNSQYMLYAAAALRGGLEPDLGRDTDWWGAPAWQYAYYALVIYLRVAAERTGRSVPALAGELLSQPRR